MTAGAGRGPPLAGLLALLILALLALPGLGYADEPESETHIQQGVELRRSGRNADALVEFQKAFALDPTPRARAQVGLALQALGDWLGAERWIGEALRFQDDAWIAQYRSTLEGAMATIGAHLGRLYVEAEVDEGEVLVNGASVHALPAAEPIRVVAGTLDVVVRAPGYVPARRAVEVAAGGEVHVAFKLDPLAATPSGRSPATPAGERAGDVAATSARPRSTVGGTIALAATGVLAVVGIVAWRIYQADVATYNDDGQCQRPGGGNRGQQCGGYRDSANVALGVEIGSFAGAAAGAAIGTWLLWPVRSAPPTSAFRCGPYGSLGIACAGRF
jgi:hypothetical protein